MQNGRDESFEPEANGLHQSSAIAPGPTRLEPHLYPDYPHEPVDDRDDPTETLRQYVHLFLKRKWLILAVALVALVVGTVRTALQVPIYTSTARIQIDREATKVVEGGGVTADNSGGQEFLRTHYQLLRTRAVSERIASSLQLHEDDDFLRPRSTSILGAVRSAFGPSEPETPATPTNLLRAATSIVANNIVVRPVAGSRLVDLSYKDPDPSRAQKNCERLC